MAKFQLTISADYVPSWGLAEGLREAVQNGLDGAQAGHTFEVQPPTRSNPVLRLINKGITLQRSIWLMGTTSKSSGDYRGCYGEGLKLGALALVRAGRSVTFANGEEDWRVKLEPSAAFDDKPVVTVYTVKRRQPATDFTVSIECSPEEWREGRTRFIDLLDEEPEAFVEHNTDSPVPLHGMSNAIILDPAFAGHLYVKGILVETRDGVSHGYNFADASVDRDRSMVKSYDLQWGVARLWDRALDGLDGPAVEPVKVLDFLESDSVDARCFEMRSPSSVARKLLEHEWIKRHGKDTVPVCRSEEANFAGHFGLRPIMSSKAVQFFFRGSSVLDIGEIRRTRKVAPTRTWKISDLSFIELANLQAAAKLVNAGVSEIDYLRSLEDRLEVVDFPDAKVFGRHDGNVVPARILISRSALLDFCFTLQILVHEVSHDAGPDGDASHERAGGELFSRIALNLLTGQHPCPHHLLDNRQHLASTSPTWMYPSSPEELLAPSPLVL